MPIGRVREAVRWVLVCMATALAQASPAAAQRVELLLDGGAGRLAQDDRAGLSFAYVGGTLRLSGAHLVWTLQGAVAQQADVDPAPFIATSLAYVAGVAPSWRTEVTGGMGGTFGSDGRSRFGGVRETLRAGPLRLWAGGAVGDTRRTVTTSLNSVVEVGAIVPLGVHALTVEAHQWRTADWPLVEAAGYYLARPAKAYDLGDVSATLRLRPGPLELLLSGGWRTGRQATVGSSFSYGASTQIALAREAALVLGVARQWADPMRGTPEGVVANLGVRWQWASGALARPYRPANQPSIEALLERDDAGRTVLVLDVRASAGARVEYATSVNDWTPVTIAQNAGRFIARVGLPAGNHRVAVRIDGGAWQCPAGFPRVDDELGGDAALVVVPPPGIN
jgi:hypothetical protein